MNLNGIREGELKNVFDALEEAFEATGTDYYIIGALARDIWYSKCDKKFRQTKDIDLAVLVGSQQDYEAVKQYLKDKKNFAGTKGNSFVLLTPSGIQVDILPFGSIEIDSGVNITGEGLTSVKVNGFMEVYQEGTEPIQVKTGHSFKIATLPSIILLKLIAFDDRPEQRTKDARDIANIIFHFFDLQADLIYDHHADLFLEEKNEQSLEDISATVIGREIKRICAANPELSNRIKEILLSHIAEKEDSVFVRNMVAETDSTAERSVQWLQNIFSVLND